MMDFCVPTTDNVILDWEMNSNEIDNEVIIDGETSDDMIILNETPGAVFVVESSEDVIPNAEARIPSQVEPLDLSVRIETVIEEENIQEVVYILSSTSPQEADVDRRSQSQAAGPVNEPAPLVAEKDYLEVSVNNIIRGQSINYKVMGFLGAGAYGKVLKCQNQENGQIVAMKTLKSSPIYMNQGLKEINNLNLLRSVGAHRFNIVHMEECFIIDRNICMVFESLAISLFDYMVRSSFKPIECVHVRSIAMQMFVALDKLTSIGLIHADIKPDNIMLVDPVRQPWRVKLIDFGLAVRSEEVEIAACIQTKYYRSPEVILGLPYNEAIDMWSLGCTLVELLVGFTLFPGTSENCLLRYFLEFIDETRFPTWMMVTGEKTRDFFTYRNRTETLYLEPQRRDRHEPNRQLVFKDIRRARNKQRVLYYYNTSNPETSSFLELISSMLEVNPYHRITAENALRTIMES